MIAAIYARKSTDQTGASDEAKSVARQILRAKEFAVTKGWTVSDEYIFTDDGISGAEYDARPGFQRLLTSLRPRAAFQRLIVSEISRLGREMLENGAVLKQLDRAGVAVWTYLDEQQVDLSSFTGKAMLTVRSLVADSERELARARTHDALKRKVEMGHVAGGAVFGYDNVEKFSELVGPGGRQKRLYVVRQINAAQAAVLVLISELYASRHGYTRIATHLTRERVTSPRGRGWAPSTIREMLHNPLYRGEIVWNRTQKRDSWGIKDQKPRSASQWVRKSAPELCIIPPELWERVRQRLEHNAASYARREGGTFLSRPRSMDGYSRYLLTGFTACSVCRGPVGAETRMHGSRGKRRKVHFYACQTSRRRGHDVCANTTALRQDVLDPAVLGSINDLLDEHILKAAVDRAIARWQAGAAQHLNRRAQIERELLLLKSRVARFVDAIGRGEAVDPLLVAMRADEDRRRALEAELQRLAEVELVAKLDGAKVRADVMARASDIRALLGRHTTQARQILRRILVSKIEMKPVVKGGRRGYRFIGKLSVERLLTGVALDTRAMVVAPTGFEPVF